VDMQYLDRKDAGQQLGKTLQDKYGGQNDVRVFGLPRGGVPVAYEVARALQAPLDVFVVRKLGLPGNKEFAMGAIASGDVAVLNPAVAHSVDRAAIESVIAEERIELHRRERLYRDRLPPPDMANKTVILIDDGLATGSTMHAAVAAVRQLQPKKIIVAVPVGAKETCRTFQGNVDDVICLKTPQAFRAVGQWYINFSQTSDEEVRTLLDQARRHEEVASQTPQAIIPKESADESSRRTSIR